MSQTHRLVGPRAKMEDTTVSWKTPKTIVGTLKGRVHSDSMLDLLLQPLLPVAFVH